MVYGRGFFYKSGWQWNWFDLILVSFQLFEMILGVVTTDQKLINLSFARVLRIMRLVRVMRLVRILRFIRELRTLVSSITNSLKSLVWTAYMPAACGRARLQWVAHDMNIVIYQFHIWQFFFCWSQPEYWDN